MFEYTFTKDATIITPFNAEFNDIKKDIVQGEDCIINKSTYPNGVVIEMHQYSDRIFIKCNKELIENSDGTITIKL